MKTILTIIMSIYCIFYPTSAFPVCDKYSILRNIPPKLTLERGLDAPNHNSLYSKILHNKGTFFAHEASKCYFNFLNPKFIFQAVGPLNLFFIIYLCFSKSKSKYLTLPMILAVPFIHIATADQKLAVIVFQLTAIIGARELFNPKELKNK